MTITLKCKSCGRRFYIQGKAEELVNKYSNAALHLRMIGYKNLSASVWELVENNAKCCESPDIHMVEWGTFYDF